MKGKYRIIIQNKRIRYDIEIERNITIIRGDSATGKTVLVEMIREFQENGTASGIELECEKKCAVLYGQTWKAQLSVMKDSIIFIDEGNSFAGTKEFAAFIQKTDNYYVIVARESLPSLPYSIEEVYGIRNSGKYGSLKRTYNELYHLYGMQDYTHPVKPDMVITEDSNSGFQFFSDVCEKSGKVCVSAYGKSNVFTTALSCKEEEILIIADGAAFGSEMEKMVKLLEVDDRFHLYLPESFEWLILKSNLLSDTDLKDILEEPYLYIESSENFSWERYFTKLLISRTSDTYMKYTKRVLNPFYMQSNIEAKILQELEQIEL